MTEQPLTCAWCQGHFPHDGLRDGSDAAVCPECASGTTAANPITAELIGALEAARDFLAGSWIESGICCCGEPVSAHDPYHSNHAPKDELAHQASVLCERIADAIQLAVPLDGRGFTPWEHEPDEFDRQIQDDLASGTLTEGGDVEQAPSDSLSGPTGNAGDAQ